MLGNSLLLRVVATTATSSAFSAVGGTLLVLYCVRDLHQSPSTAGFVVFAGAAGGLVGAVSVGPVSRGWAPAGRSRSRR